VYCIVLYSSLSEISINGLRTVEDVIRQCGGIMNVKVTSAMLKAVRNAASLHRQRLEAEKRKLENDAEKLKKTEEEQRKNS